MSAQRVGGPWLTVAKLIELFTAMGCEVHFLEGHIVGDDGEQRKVRFLYNPETEGFASLSDIDDTDHIPPAEVEGWERRLGLSIPKGGDK